MTHDTMRVRALHEAGRLTSTHHFTDSGSNFSNAPPGPLTAVAVQILTHTAIQDIMLTLTHRGLNQAGGIRIHSDVVPPKFQR